MKYATSKTCSREIDFEVENNIVTSCEFVGGCMGNTGCRTPRCRTQR